ncbi:hypothetical protein ABMY26_19810 [Azospirillum sp. HJ39]|uniref:hypothetical protein n=1 Tax=Azospirillum sp. HJ39 TaxID=3159496 RepID=UPI0035560806
MSDPGHPWAGLGTPARIESGGDPHIMVQRENIQEALTRRAEMLLQRMQRIVESSRPEQFDIEAGLLGDLIKNPDFPRPHKSAFQEAAKQLQRQGHERTTDRLLSEAENGARSGDRAARDRLVAKARETLSKAVKSGSGKEFRKEMEKRLSSVAAMEIAPAPVRQKLRKRQAQAQPPNGVEKRNTIRYTEPVLTVAINHVEYRTIDWSTRGLLLNVGPAAVPLIVGDQVRVEISCPNVEMRHRQQAKVARRDDSTNSLALAFLDIDPVILAFLKAIE